MDPDRKARLAAMRSGAAAAGAAAGGGGVAWGRSGSPASGAAEGRRAAAGGWRARAALPQLRSMGRRAHPAREGAYTLLLLPRLAPRL